MKLVGNLMFASALLGLAACDSAPKPAPAPESQPPPPASQKTYGQPVRAGETLKISAVVADPASHASKNVLVEGSVRRACTKRGCWMELADGMESQAPGCRVTFKDYGFFVPTDSSGSQARVEGTVKMRDLSPAEVAHMEREGAHFPSKLPDGSAREVSLVATGVELKRL